VGLNGAAPDNSSSEAVAPPNGNLVVFTSRATNLVANDTNGLSDIFQYSPERGTELVSISQVNGGFASPNPNGFGASEPAVSNLLPDGSYAIAFTSDSTDLVPGYQSPISSTFNPRQLYLRIPNLNKTILISAALTSTATLPIGANAACDEPSVTALANPTRYIIAFRSAASNIQENFAPSLPRRTIFVFTITINDSVPVISQREAANGAPGAPPLTDDLNNPVVSGGGRFIAFTSKASLAPNVDTSGKDQVWLFEHAARQVRLISTSPDSAPGNDDSFAPSISFQGEFVAFLTKATNIAPNQSGKTVAVLANVKNGTIRQVNLSTSGTPSDGEARAVKVSPGGKLVLFSDTGSNLVQTSGPAATTQTYVKDPATEATLLLSKDSNGQPADGNSGGFPPSTGGFQGSKSPLTFGSLGFNSPTIYAAFVSGAQSLTTAGTSSDASPNVFRVSITPPKPRFIKNIAIEAPPDVVIQSVRPGGRGAKISVEMQEFDTSNTASTTSSDSVLAEASESSRLRYTLEIRKSNGTRRITRITSRNTTTIRKLTPGRYTMRYRVSKTTGQTTSKSRYSPKNSFEIT
jgi:hypothetical protein